MIKGNGLQDAYSATLARIKEQKEGKARLAMDTLMLLSHSARPLNANELCYALGVEIGSQDLDLQNVPAIETLLGCSLGLVIVEASTYTVRLVHYSLQEYLSNNTDLFHSPHSRIAQVCLTYLNFRCIIDIPLILDCSLPEKPFLEYASCYWGTHARRGMTESVNTLALRILSRFDQHISSRILLYQSRDNHDRELRRSNSTGFTGLHGAAYLGIVKTAVALLEMKKWDLNATDAGGSTPILWAVRKTHGAMVEMFLARGDVNLDIADKKGRTPLSWAASLGCGGIVKMLLKKGVRDLNAVDEDGRTPLFLAAAGIHECTLGILLERKDVSPNVTDNRGESLLSWAALAGYTDILKMLLERGDIDPNIVGEGTPLHSAIRKGIPSTVETLLKRADITPDIPNKSGRTPLSLAAGEGKFGFVARLLARKDVTPNTADNGGRTPLSWAAENGSQEAVRLLLKRRDKDLNAADKEGRTPLHWAAVRGNEGAVMALLEREDITPNTASKDGRTPLSLAAGKVRSDCAARLLEREDITPNTADEGGRTPLSWAAGNGSEGAVKALLKRGDITPDTADKDGRTPLSWAAGNRRESIVKMLLERKDVIPDTTDKHGRTPLSWATETGSWGIKMLLERKDVTPDTVDKNSPAPLSWTREDGHTIAVEILQERRRVSQNMAMTNPMPLSLASKKRHGGAPKRQFENEGSVSQSVGSSSSISISPANRAKVVAEPQPSIPRSLAILGTLRESSSQLNDSHSPTIDLRLIQTKAPPQENKSCKREKTKWKAYLRRLKTMCEKVKRTFKAPENVL